MSHEMNDNEPEISHNKLTKGKYVSPPSTLSLKYMSIVAIRWPPRFKLNCMQMVYNISISVSSNK